MNILKNTRFISRSLRLVLYRNGKRRFTISVPSKSLLEINNTSKPSNPNIGSIFSKSTIKANENLLEASVDTFPNPLYSMTKENILNLTEIEYEHLLQIPYESILESDRFCLNIIEIVNSYILQNTKLVSKFIKKRDNEISNILVNTLRRYYANDKVRKSILEFVYSPTSKVFKEMFFENLSYIISTTDKSKHEKSEILMNYLRTLSLVDIVNPRPLLLRDQLYRKVVKLIPSKRHSELYSYFLHLNIQTYLLSELEILKKKLVTGSNLDKFIVRTGWIDPKWHDVERSSFSSSHKLKMLNFFTIKDLRTFTEHAIQKNDVANANLYLNLLVSKFESKCNQIMKSRYKMRKDDSSISDDVQMILNIILNHIMVFKGSKNCIKVLNYMIKNNLSISFETLFIILQNLRAQGFYKEGLVLINNLNLDKISLNERQQLVNEIVKVIKLKYPASPKVLIGYIASIFNGSTNNNEGLNLLNNLKLLGITHGNNQLRNIESLELIQMANIDPSLSGFETTSEALSSVYGTVLNSLPLNSVTPDLIYGLYQSYFFTIKTSREQNSFELFNDKNLDDHVITLLVKYLLKSDPNSLHMDLQSSKANFEIASKIFLDFNDNFSISRRNRTVFLHELLIYSSLMVHHDFHFASKVLKLSRSNNLPLSFNQIFPFIMFHYSKKEFDLAKMWYNEMVRNGVKATAGPAKELFRISRELNWDVNGFTYRKFNIYKNYKKKEEYQRLGRDPILLFGNINIEDEVTEELIEARNGNDFNFCDELASLVQEASQVIS